MSMIRATIDDKVYGSASEILASLGLDVNAAVRLFFQGVVLHKGIPFDLRLTEAQLQSVRRETNRQATLEAREIARTGGPGYESVEAMLAAMEKDPA